MNQDFHFFHFSKKMKKRKNEKMKASRKPGLGGEFIFSFFHFFRAPTSAPPTYTCLKRLLGASHAYIQGPHALAAHKTLENKWFLHPLLVGPPNPKNKKMKPRPDDFHFFRISTKNEKMKPTPSPAPRPVPAVGLHQLNHTRDPCRFFRSLL